MIDALTEGGFHATILASTGGFLREGNSTVLIGVDDAHVDEVLATVRRCCHRREQYVSPLPPIIEPVDSYVTSPVKVEIGGAMVFVLEVEKQERF